MDRTDRPIPHPHNEPIRLRTLILLRWVAILGQLVAVAVAVALGLHFQNGMVLGVIAIGAGLNLVLSWRGVRPDGWQVTAQLALDVAQVAALLVLTGGMSNPFALLILAPVTIAATALNRNNVLFLGLATAAMVSFAAVMSLPLVDRAGHELKMPHLLEVGHWFALVIAICFFAAYALRVSNELRARATALSATEMALAREQKLQHLGGVVAAAAHEMGTPLATIKLISTELADELSDILEDRPELAGDLALLRQSADRCRDILRSMGRAGKDDVMLHNAPLGALIEEAAAPHAARGRIVQSMSADGSSPEPMVKRDPGVIHGLRNLVQNAVDFAAHTVRVEAAWNASRVMVTISDDGPGYSPAMLARIGEPFLRARRPDDDRPGYEGMGLGLFIAKTLLERSGATLTFRNGGPGAVVEVAWPRARIESDIRGPLGDNPEITA
ncbi:sensor histidine kinase [Paracoccus suum]|uniref:histidine kinase n=1 Tax=Paracoccus suum TaxID=2259340 RepID=A0A344PHJ7_9RHOB|nr:ActS/PrrB/RegB family redox-sensitive histidine kinase [Paracoccus suum]AXC48852.1 sensor histidine kinase [Paracoccus suum]